MSSGSPDVVIYDSQGNMLAVQNSAAIPASTPALLFAGSDGYNSRYITVDGYGHPVVVGAGVAGTPDGYGIVTIQGIAGGTNVPVSQGTTPWVVSGSFTVDKASSSNITSVVGSTSSTTILTSNSSRVSATIFNATNKLMYVALGSTASTSLYSLQVPVNSFYELTTSYTGAISAIWPNGVSGDAMITELQ